MGNNEGKVNEHSTFEEVHFLKNNNQYSYLKIGNYLIPAEFRNYIVNENDFEYDRKFSSKKELLYELMIIKLKAGKKISNYKRSKYYLYYIERIRFEYPEYLI